MHKISILTSVYNKGKWLDRWFESVCNQTYKNLEIVVVDNASTDNSPQIINTYAAKDSRVTVVPLQMNVGPSGGYNAALEAATGDYLTFADADDYIDLDYIEKLYTALREEDADVAMCVNDIVYERNLPTRHKPWPKNKIVVEGDMLKYLPCQLLDEKSQLYFGDTIPEIGATWIKLYNADIIRNDNLRFNTDLWIWTDFDFHIRALRHIKKFVCINSTTYHFFQTADESVTRNRGFDKIKVERILLALDCIEKDIKKNMFPALRRASLRFYYERFYNILCIYRDNISLFSYNGIKAELRQIKKTEPIAILFKNVNSDILSSLEKIKLWLLKNDFVFCWYVLDRSIGKFKSIKQKFIRK